MSGGNRKLRVGVFGGRRGQSMISVLLHHPDAELVAVCEGYAPQLEKCRQLAESEGSKVTCYEDFDRFFDHDMDAVVLANYATEHAPFAVRLLDSGRHVCSELMVCQTMAEAVRLVEAVERNKRVYAFAENVCYFPAVMAMQRIYREGRIGEFLHAEGQYIHDCESLWGVLTQGRRDHWRNWTPATFYIGHSAGPVISITGTRAVRITAYESPNVNKRRLGGLSADASVVVCQMDNGATAVFMPWSNLKRGPGMLWFSVYGSKGMMETDRWGDEMWDRLNIYRDDDPSGVQSYRPELPPWAKVDEARADFGAADFLTMHVFIESILDRPGKEYTLDVYQGLDITLPGILGYRSIWEGNVPLAVPDFRRKDVRDKYRDDNWCVDPKMAGPGQPKHSCASGPVEAPDSVYEKQVAELLAENS